MRRVEGRREARSLVRQSSRITKSQSRKDKRSVHCGSDAGSIISSGELGGSISTRCLRFLPPTKSHSSAPRHISALNMLRIDGPSPSRRLVHYQRNASRQSSGRPPSRDWAPDGSSVRQELRGRDSLWHAQSCRKEYHSSVRVHVASSPFMIVPSRSSIFLDSIRDLAGRIDQHS